LSEIQFVCIKVGTQKNILLWNNSIKNACCRYIKTKNLKNDIDKKYIFFRKTLFFIDLILCKRNIFENGIIVFELTSGS